MTDSYRMARTAKEKAQLGHVVNILTGPSQQIFDNVPLNPSAPHTRRARKSFNRAFIVDTYLR